jgi:DNA-binding NtrC family response regulator
MSDSPRGERVMIVDDDRALRRIIKDRLTSLGYQCHAVESGEAALAELEEFDPALILLDLRMPGMDGFEVLDVLTQRRARPEVIVITAHGTVDSAVRAMQIGAADFVPKPFEPAHLETVVAKVLAAQSLKGRVSALETELSARHTLVPGESKAMSDAIDVAKRAAPSDASVLLLGESGSGKEVLARYVHANSARCDGPFVVVNCATLTGDLVQSELFGHERGAFTGATAARKGRIEQAQGGTLFLDELAEFPPEVQAKLLRVIQEREFERVGGTRTQTADVRIVAATHQDLRARIEDGSFREDLFYRLNVVSVRVPPVRDRPEDLPALLEHFLERYGREAKHPGLRLDEDAEAKLLAYAWPGNVREVSNVMERAVVLAQGDTIHLGDLPEEVRSLGPAPARASEATAFDDATYHEAVLEAKRAILQRALDQNDGHQTNAARALGLTQPYMSRLLKNVGLK